MTIKTIIVDDEIVSREALKLALEDIKEIKVVAECANAIEAIEAMNEHSVDLVFLDIEMPDMSGMDLMRNFKMPEVVFVTSNKEFAPDAFTLDATDFVIKPVEISRLLMAVEKVKDNLEHSQKESPFVFIKHDSRYVKIFLTDINYVEALADYVNIYVHNKRYTILSTMKSIESRLPTPDFVRVHRSYIVRLDKVDEIEDSTISIGEKFIPISRSYKDRLMKSLKML